MCPVSTPAKALSLSYGGGRPYLGPTPPQPHPTPRRGLGDEVPQLPSVCPAQRPHSSQGSEGHESQIRQLAPQAGPAVTSAKAKEAQCTVTRPHPTAAVAPESPADATQPALLTPQETSCPHWPQGRVWNHMPLPGVRTGAIPGCTTWPGPPSGTQGPRLLSAGWGRT